MDGLGVNGLRTDSLRRGAYCMTPTQRLDVQEGKDSIRLEEFE